MTLHDDIREINTRVGKNIENRRRILRMSQADLGRLVGVSSQQVHKYETGETRIPLDKLYLLTEALNISIQELFMGVDMLHQKADNSFVEKARVLNEQETQRLLRNYVAINDDKTRGSISQLVRQIATISNMHKKMDSY